MSVDRFVPYLLPWTTLPNLDERRGNIEARQDHDESL